MFCPQCKSEFVSGITECTKCHVPLVTELRAEGFSDEDTKRYFEGKTAELVTAGHMALMREMQRVLELQSIPSRIVPEDESDDGMHQRFRLEIVKDDLDRLKKLSGEKWADFLRAEGLTPTESKEAVLAEGAETECPACGTKFTPKTAETAECPDCGLFLGVPA